MLTWNYGIQRKVFVWGHNRHIKQHISFQMADNLSSLQWHNFNDTLSQILMISYLYSCLGQVGHHGETFAHDDIRIVRLRERFLERCQLLVGERRTTATLLSVGAITCLQYYVWKRRKMNQHYCGWNLWNYHPQPCTLWHLYQHIGIC